ncbi:MAG: lysophospholipid acyltransferase family protein [Pseudomonadota bacterium]
MTAARPSATARTLNVAYGCYAWSAFTLGITVAVIGIVLLPGVTRRRSWAARCARAFFAAAGIRATVTDLDRLPNGPSVVVANHASYLDGVVLQAFLPPHYSYVIKNEMQKVPVAHYFLRRIGSRFVERFKKSGGARDARQLMRAADEGASLAFFPEGTFIAEPGLGKFYLGAFATALKGALPVVPVVIEGTRNILPAGRRLPRRGSLSVQVLTPIATAAGTFETPRALAEAARQKILTVLPEPDLTEHPA